MQCNEKIIPFTFGFYRLYLVTTSVTFKSKDASGQAIEPRWKVNFLQDVVGKGNVQREDGLQFGYTITKTNFSILVVLLKRWQTTTGDPLCLFHIRINIVLPLHMHKQSKLSNHQPVKWSTWPWPSQSCQRKIFVSTNICMIPYFPYSLSSIVDCVSALILLCLSCHFIYGFVNHRVQSFHIFWKSLCHGWIPSDHMQL